MIDRGIRSRCGPASILPVLSYVRGAAKPAPGTGRLSPSEVRCVRDARDQVTGLPPGIEPAIPRALRPSVEGLVQSALLHPRDAARTSANLEGATRSLEALTRTRFRGRELSRGCNIQRTTAVVSQIGMRPLTRLSRRLHGLGDPASPARRAGADGSCSLTALRQHAADLALARDVAPTC